MTVEVDVAGNNKRRFRVALSFAGEKRDYVRAVAEYLAEKLGGEPQVLYDKYHENDFARFKLDGYLPRLYTDESDLIAVFWCDDYKTKLWTGLEWQEIEKLKDRHDSWRVMPHKFADSESTKLEPTDGYIYIGEGRSPITTAKGILERLKSNDQKLMDGEASPPEGLQGDEGRDDEDFIPNDEEIAGLKEAIAELLDKPGLSPIKKAVALVLGVGHANPHASDLASEWVDVEAKEGIVTLLEHVFNVAGEVVKNGYHHDLWMGLEELLGYSLRLSSFIRQQGWHTSDPAGVMISGFRSAAALEAGLADRYDLPPRYEYDAANHTVRGKYGRYLEKPDLRSWEKSSVSKNGVNVRETGWSPDEIAKEAVQVVYKMVNEGEGTEKPLDDFEKRKLNRTLKTRRNKHFGELHRLEAPAGSEENHPLSDDAVCVALKNELPELPVVKLTAMEPQEVEAEIASLVDDFYRLLNKYR